MTIKKNLFLSLMGVTVFIANFLLVNDINIFYISTIISIFAFLIIPGLLVILSLNIKRISFWEYLFLVVGFSISILEFGGLLTNQLLPHLGNTVPLSLRPLLIVFDLYIFILLLIAKARFKANAVKIPKLNISRQKLLLYMAPVTFPILAGIGAISINNNGTNLITIFLLGLIGVFSMGIIFFHKRIPSNLYPYSIFFIALALLFTTSLRGWFIVGHDIQREYYVFKLTNLHSLWDINFYKDAYNACLSITILPTILSHFLSIKDIYIYKLIYQILFSLSAVMVFYILRKYTSKISAFIASIYFMSFPTFFNDMPFLARQEIGFIFFGIMLYVILLPTLPLRIRKIIFLISGLSIVISHYSTNYVVLALLSGILFFSFFFKFALSRKIVINTAKKFRISTQSKFMDSPFVSVKMLLVLFLFTFFWNSQFTKTSSTIKDVASKVIQSILIKSPNDAKSIDVSYSLFSSHKISPQEQLNEYVNENIEDAKKRFEGPFYDKSAYERYKIRIIPSAEIPLTPIGKILVFLHFPVSLFQDLIRQLSAASMQIFVFMGILVILLHRNRSLFDVQYIFLCVSGVSLLLLMIVIPQVSVEYGLLRLFLQLLFLLSLPVVLATDAILKKIKEPYRIYLVGALAVIFFLNLTGFISHTTGGYSPQLTLDNYGLYYDAFYVRQTDVSSVEWLKVNKILVSAPVQADNSGISKLIVYADTTGLREIFPAIIRKNAYVFLTDASIKNAIVSFEANTLIFTSPVEFLSNNKNLIYNNGSNRIYK